MSSEADQQFLSRLQIFSGRLLDNKYRILAVMGHGRFGGVVSAAIAQTGQNVAIKIPREDGPALVHEAYIFSLLGNTKYTVDCFDQKEDLLDTRFLVMSLEKQSLAEYYQFHPAISNGVVAAISIDLIKGLRFMHSRGVVHRDVNPGNVLIPRSEGKLRAIWTDFGTAGIREDGDSWHCVFDTAECAPNFFTPLYVGTGRAPTHVEMDDMWSMTYLMLFLKRSSIVTEDPVAWQKVKKDLFVKLEQILPEPERPFEKVFWQIYYRGRNAGPRCNLDCYKRAKRYLRIVPGYSRSLQL